MDKKQLRNTLLLICAAFIWGTAFVAQSVGSGYMGAYTFLASRSWLACVFLLGMLLVRAGQKKRRQRPALLDPRQKRWCWAVSAAARRCLRHRRPSRWASARPAPPRPAL